MEEGERRSEGEVEEEEEGGEKGAEGREEEEVRG